MHSQNNILARSAEQYRSDIDMEWKDIFDLFPDWTQGALRMRWPTLQPK